MGLNKGHRRKVDRYSTIIFVSKSSKNPKTITFSKFLKYPIILLIIAVLGTSFFYAQQHIAYVKNLEQQTQLASSTISDMEKDIVEKADTIESLQIEKKNQQEELENFQELSRETIKEFENLIQAQEELKEKLNEHKKTTSTSPTSDVPELSIDTVEKKILRTSNKSLNNFELKSHLVYNNFVQLQSSIAEEKDLISSLNNKADLLIPYWSSYPSIYPTWGTISSYYGWRKNPRGYGMEYHKGLDMRNSHGADVYATGDGIVTKAEYSPSYGYFVEINHGYGITTKTAHHSRLCVTVGQRVKKGDVVAKIGSTGYSTGPHTHYEVLVNGKTQNPLDFIQPEK